MKAALVIVACFMLAGCISADFTSMVLDLGTSDERAESAVVLPTTDTADL